MKKERVREKETDEEEIKKKDTDIIIFPAYPSRYIDKTRDNPLPGMGGK